MRSPVDKRVMGSVLRKDYKNMAKITNKNPRIGNEVKAPVPAEKTSTPVRNSPIPKVSGKKEISREQIAKRAYEISNSGKGGSEDENWLRAEQELRGS